MQVLHLPFVSLLMPSMILQSTHACPSIQATADCPGGTLMFQPQGKAWLKLDLHLQLTDTRVNGGMVWENGVGTFIGADGSTFYGPWSGGKMHGQIVSLPSRWNIPFKNPSFCASLLTGTIQCSLLHTGNRLQMASHIPYQLKAECQCAIKIELLFKMGCKKKLGLLANKVTCILERPSSTAFKLESAFCRCINQQ